MNTKLRIFLVGVLAMLTTQSYAGRQGLHFLYGGGVAIVAPQVQSDVISHSATGAGELVVGIEEDGWAVEYSAVGSLSAGTGAADRDYKMNTSQVSLSYRTIERDNMYFKYSYGLMGQDVSYASTSATLLTNAIDYTGSGNAYSFAVGLRLKQSERLELAYTYYARKDENQPSIYMTNMHMITLRYLFGGVPFELSGM